MLAIRRRSIGVLLVSIGRVGGAGGQEGKFGVVSRRKFFP